jgi:hypothetical protein
VHCMIICDDQTRILDFIVVGSVHDNRVWFIIDQLKSYERFLSFLKFLFLHLISAFKQVREYHIPGKGQEILM